VLAASAERTVSIASLAALEGPRRSDRAVTGALTLAAALAAASGFVAVNGHRMYYGCSGSGRPTVVLDAGSPDTTTTWRWVQPKIARFTRVCAYDRAGLGRSAPAPPGRGSPTTQVRELRLLLEKARIPGPYVLVGHSWGGFLARLFAYEYRGDSAGAVLVDATTFPYLTAAEAAKLPRKLTREGIDIRTAIAQSAAITSLGNLPVVVLGSNRPPLAAKLLQAQDAEAALSTNAVDALALNSTHYIQRPAPRGQPSVVVTAVRAVVDAVRARRRLPGCAQVFARLAVACR
jgi:pimeloyl-ACP methyl ester carboxylesterase